MKICVAGQGAFGQKHLDALKRISGVEVVSLIGGNPKGTEEVAKKYGIPHWGNDLGRGHRPRGRGDLGDAYADAPRAGRTGDARGQTRPDRNSHRGQCGGFRSPGEDGASETGVVAMAGHVRRFNPSHQWVHKRRSWSKAS